MEQSGDRAEDSNWLDRACEGLLDGLTWEQSSPELIEFVQTLTSKWSVYKHKETVSEQSPFCPSETKTSRREESLTQS